MANLFVGMLDGAGIDVDQLETVPGVWISGSPGGAIRTSLKPNVGWIRNLALAEGRLR